MVSRPLVAVSFRQVDCCHGQRQPEVAQRPEKFAPAFLRASANGLELRNSGRLCLPLAALQAMQLGIFKVPPWALAMT